MHALSSEFSLRAVGVLESISDAQKINAAFDNNVADQIYGIYAEGSYNILPLMCPDAEQSLWLFTRYEKYNTQSKVTGFTANAVHDRNDITIGATFKPTFNTAFKIDYQFMNNAAEANTKQFNMGVGYNF